MAQARSANFSESEKTHLIDLVDGFKDIIENKKTDTVTVKQKLKAWEDLAVSFNSHEGNAARSGVQLKTCYENMKRRAKKNAADDKVELYKTGGGSSSVKMNEQERRIMDLSINQFQPLINPSDSDASYHNDQDYSVSTLRESVTKKEYPHCDSCGNQIPRGPFITALGKTWCPDHFVCVKEGCRRPLQGIGFVEEQGQLYCEYCFEKFLAPTCNKCSNKFKGDCLNATGQHFHPECFSCTYCRKLFGNNPFFLEDGQPYCEADWNKLFTTKCFACGFPIEAGDRWVEALNNNYHSQCFNCSMCKKNLEGQSFYAKSGRPFCKNHAR